MEYKKTAENTKFTASFNDIFIGVLKQLFLIIRFHIFHCIFTTLKNKQVKRDAIF